MSFNQNFSLYNEEGSRKYLNSNERENFLKFSSELEDSKKLFCLLLYYTGCRISEALNAEVRHFQFKENGFIMIKTLKKRNNIPFRKIYLPPYYLNELERYIVNNSCIHNTKIWRFCRQTGYRIIKNVMKKAGVTGAMSCPKGLRHSYAINAILKNVPLPTLQKWMGHSSLEITSIYLQVVNREEINFAKKIW